MTGQYSQFLPPDLSQLEGDPLPVGPRRTSRKQSKVSRVLAGAHDMLMNFPGVVMVGEGLDEIGDPAIIVGVKHVHQFAALPAQVGGVKVVTQVVGEVDALRAGDR